MTGKGGSKENPMIDPTPEGEADLGEAMAETQPKWGSPSLGEEADVSEGARGD